MSRRWIIAAAIVIALAESSLSMPARADGGEALLERLLDPQQTQAANPLQRR